MGWYCDECGGELSGPRRRCVVAATGLHRVSQRQLDLQAELARRHLDALRRAAAATEGRAA